MFSSALTALTTTICLNVLCGVAADAESAAAEDFRVSNKVFSGSQKKPLSQSTTIFLDGVVYDYLDEPDEVIVYDKADGRFVLLDMARKVRAEVTTKEVVALTERLQQLAGSQADPFVRFLAAPKFTERYDRDTRELTLSSPWLTYRLVLADAVSRAVSQQYREFSDWYARLNTILSPGSKPPAARLAVNEALAKRKATASEVRLTLTPKRGFPPKRVEIRSEHQLVPQVAESDMVRVGQTRQFMDIFQPVSFQQYREMVGR